MPEADAEHRNTAERLADDPRLLDERGGIARAVREQDAVVGGEIVRVADVRVDGDRRARRLEALEDRALEAVVDHRDAHVAVLVGPVRGRGRHLRDERLAFHERLATHLLERVGRRQRLLVRHDDAPHRAGVAEP